MCALLLGERLDTRALESDKPLGVAPLTVYIPGGGVAVLSRYGAVVLVGTATAAMDNLVVFLTPLVTAALPVPERDDALLLVRPHPPGLFRRFRSSRPIAERRLTAAVSRPNP
jgi:hypothetical protein